MQMFTHGIYVLELIFVWLLRSEVKRPFVVDR